MAKQSLIMQLVNAFSNPDSEQAKKEFEKYDVSTNTLYSSGRRTVEPITYQVSANDAELIVDESEFSDIISGKRKHALYKGAIYIGNTLIIRETANFKRTGRIVAKDICCLTTGDGTILNADYSIVQWE